jgi:hypothetical protein
MMYYLIKCFKEHGEISMYNNVIYTDRNDAIQELNGFVNVESMGDSWYAHGYRYVVEALDERALYGTGPYDIYPIDVVEEA